MHFDASQVSAFASGTRRNDGVYNYGKPKGELRGELPGETELELAGEGWLFITSSKRVRAAGLSLSDFRATAANPSVASLLSVAFSGEGLGPAFAIADSKARRASSVFPASREARPYRYRNSGSDESKGFCTPWLTSWF